MGHYNYHLIEDMGQYVLCNAAYVRKLCSLFFVKSDQSKTHSSLTWAFQDIGLCCSQAIFRQSKWPVDISLLGDFNHLCCCFVHLH